MKVKVNNIVVPAIETAAATGTAAPTGIDAITAEIGKYSITPRSLKERSYDADLKADSCFIEKYKNTEGIIAKRFGINLLSSTLLSEIEENLASSSAADSTLAPIAAKPNAGAGESPAAADAGGSSPATVDAGIKSLKNGSAHSRLAKGDSVKSPLSVPASSGASSRLKIDISKIIHTKAELAVIEKAIVHLFSSPDKAVVIDSFARVDGKIKYSEKEGPEIHSTVLYKNNTIDGRKEIIVIDPSNFSYTAHLGSADIVKTLKAQEVTIKTFPKNPLQIYKSPNGKTGPGPDEYRDCIDIAVKLTFGFNAASEWVYIADCKLTPDLLTPYKTCPIIESIELLTTVNEEKILKEMVVMVTEKYTRHAKIIRIIPEPTVHKVISMISNNKSIDENFTFILTPGSLESARLKQSSEIENQKKFSSILAFIQQNFESVHSIDLSAATSFKSALLGHLGIGGEDE